MGYQVSSKNPPVEYKKAGEICQGVKDKSNDFGAKINE